jgi:hypothetical protein
MLGGDADVMTAFTFVLVRSPSRLPEPKDGGTLLPLVTLWLTTRNKGASNGAEQRVQRTAQIQTNARVNDSVLEESTLGY